MTDFSNLTQKVAEADAALKQAEATAKAAKAALKAERPSQMTIIRRAVIENESVTVDALMSELNQRGHLAAKKEIVQGLRSDAASFLRLLREMGRLVEPEPASDEPDESAVKTTNQPTGKKPRMQGKAEVGETQH
jgi:hypothetical protein